MRVFVICAVRDADGDYRNKLEQYVLSLEAKGWIVHIPHRDTDQGKKGIDICRQNMAAIKDADEVHIFYSPKSQGTHFDLGVSFAMGKKIVIVDNIPLTEGKSYQRMIYEWETGQ